MIKAITKGMLVCMFLYLPVHAKAWGPLGHRIVGEIADSYLTAKARKQIQKILGNETIALSSTWADFIKSDPSYRQYSTWHYINFKTGLSFAEMQKFLQTDTSTNAYTKLNFLISELKSNKLDAKQQQMYLRFLIHLAGDIHQPMHTGRPEDLGGNRVRVMWFSTPSNLHRVWDEQLIELQQLSYTEYTKSINFTTKKQRVEWQSQPMVQWFYESYEVSNKIYQQVGKPEETLGYDYNFANIESLNLQLLKGGVRLAGLLNDIYG